MKVNLHYFPGRRKGDQFDVYFRCSKAFQDRGINLNFCPNREPTRNESCDFFVVQHYMAGLAALETLDRPIVIEESEDSSMPISREALALENVIALHKVSVVMPKYINCQTRRLHSWLISGKDDYLQKHLTDPEISKIRPGIHFGMFNRMLPWIARSPCARLNEWSSRPIDVMFAGRIDVYCPEISGHRKQFFDALKSMVGLNIVCEGQRTFRAKEYRELSVRAKIIVSPWGHGELCYRDFEAMLDGCILIKPNTDFVRVLDDIVRARITYVPCAWDASDLECIIHSVLEKPCIFDEMRLENRRRALEWFSSENIAKWWHDCFKAE